MGCVWNGGLDCHSSKCAFVWCKRHCFIVKKPKVRVEKGEKPQKNPLNLLCSAYVCWGVRALLFGSDSLTFLEKLLQILRASESKCQAWANYSVFDCNLKVIQQVSTEQLISVKKEVVPSVNKSLLLHIRSEENRWPGHEDKTCRSTNGMWKGGFKLCAPPECWLVAW